MTDSDHADWRWHRPRPAEWPDEPDIRRFVEWLRRLIPASEWKARRRAHVDRLHGRNLRPTQDGLPQRHVADDDVGGWYLMLAEALIDHPANYEPAQGSRVVPFFKILGRDFDLLMSIEGVEERARRMITAERSQPDGTLFELLAALAYRRDGWPVVRFIDEQLGGPKTPDFQVYRPPFDTWSVECKRIGRSEYSKAERDEFWRLWMTLRPEFRKASIFFDLRFRCEIKAVPRPYLNVLADRLLRHGPVSVDDEWASGTVNFTDLERAQKFLEHDLVLEPSQRLFTLLTGNYDRFAAYTMHIAAKRWSGNTRYIESLSVATLARWECVAEDSVSAKARHFLRQLARANQQLEQFGPGVIHLGLDAMDGSIVEVARRPRVLEMIRDFDPRPTDLRWAYIHYFVYESPLDEDWAIEETTDWFGIGPNPGERPRSVVPIVVPPGSEPLPHPWERPV